MKNKKFNVLSPDGFPITREDTYSSPAKALKAATEWAKRYVSQGYYSSPTFGRIPIDRIVSYCKIVEV